MGNEERHDRYALGWHAGLEQARRIVMTAEDRDDALDRIIGLLIDSGRSIQEARAVGNRKKEKEPV